MRGRCCQEQHCHKLHHGNSSVELAPRANDRRQPHNRGKPRGTMVAPRGAPRLASGGPTDNRDADAINLIGAPPSNRDHHQRARNRVRDPVQGSLSRCSIGMACATSMKAPNSERPTINLGAPGRAGKRKVPRRPNVEKATTCWILSDGWPGMCGGCGSNAMTSAKRGGPPRKAPSSVAGFHAARNFAGSSSRRCHRGGPSPTAPQGSPRRRPTPVPGFQETADRRSARSLRSRWRLRRA